jgi:hypothetical protein
MMLACPLLLCSFIGRVAEFLAPASYKGEAKKTEDFLRENPSIIPLGALRGQNAQVTFAADHYF